MARLNSLELDAVYEQWLKSPNGEKTTIHDVYALTCAAEAEKGGYPADRRAELLELASRLAAVVMARNDVAIGKIEGEPFAAVNVKIAAAIIAEVDRVSGEVSK